MTIFCERNIKYNILNCQVTHCENYPLMAMRIIISCVWTVAVLNCAFLYNLTTLKSHTHPGQLLLEITLTWLFSSLYLLSSDVE